MRRKGGVSGEGRADAKAEKLREFGKFEGARKGQGDRQQGQWGRGILCGQMATAPTPESPMPALSTPHKIGTSLPACRVSVVMTCGRCTIQG